VKKFPAILFCVILYCNFAEAADPLRGAMVRKALLGGQAVDQSIPNNTLNPYALLTFNQVIYDTDGAFDPSDSSFVIPAGVHFARINVQAVWRYNTKGIRQIVILRKSPRNVDPNKYEFFTADPVSTQLANTSTTTDMGAQTSDTIPVEPGEHYAA